ncbi:hypothetical protein DB41_II00020 [Neochlamydia sp. TUME1]|nr:hypothetical protein DB41_II00020 [Neochlamydia sp. TUME1]
MFIPFLFLLELALHFSPCYKMLNKNGKASMYKIFLWAVIGIISGTAHLLAEEKADKKEEGSITLCLKEIISETRHQILINNIEIPYKAIAGNILLRNDQSKPKASISYIAYFKEEVLEPAARPLIFCFNGGPGSSSIWLHVGVFGPRRVLLSDEGEGVFPYQVIDNPHSLLDLADLVFIDPISTGYSRVASGEDAKQFHGVDEDIESLGEFVRQFITQYERWNSPKLLAGESYGTTRAAGLAGYLHDELNIYLNGMILISSVLNFQTLNDYNEGNDLPYPLYLPTYTATAWYHKKLGENLQGDLDKTLEIVKDFALTDYTSALMKGDSLSAHEYAKIVAQLADYTGLSPEFIKKANLRISPQRFSKELLRAQDLIVGRFDSRFKGEALNSCNDYPSYDPSFDAIAGTFTAAFNQYIRKELKIKNDQEYKILANLHSTWNYSKYTNQFLNMSTALRNVMTQNKALKVFVGSGYYDLATPFFATDYTFNHLRLASDLQSRASIHYYPAGHMMYVQKSSLIKMKEDISRWMKKL